MSKVLPISGFPEYLPNEQLLFESFKKNLMHHFEIYGFAPIETPAIERTETLLAKGGIDQEVYVVSRLHDQGETQKQPPALALRFDLTVPLARYVSQHYQHLAFPFKRYQIAPVWRGERAQAGRYRQFYQCDIDIIGDGSLSVHYDAEVLEILILALERLGFEEAVVHINHRDILIGFLSSLGIQESKQQVDALRIIDKKDKITSQALSDELKVFFESEDDLKKLIQFIGYKGTLEDTLTYLSSLQLQDDAFENAVKQLHSIIDSLKHIDKNIMIDLSLARGLAYYTGVVFEAKLPDYPQFGSVASGGRYDQLAEKFSNKTLPGIGLSIGLSRLFPLLLEKASQKGLPKTLTKVLVTTQDKNNLPSYREVVNQLRRKGISADLYLENKNLGQQMKYADKNGIPFVIIANAEELQEGTLVIKDMLHQKEERLSLLKIIDRLL